MSHRKEQKEAARQAREEAERAEAAHARRRRGRNLALGVAVAVLAVAVLVLLSSGSADDGGGSGDGGDKVPAGALLEGIPERGMALGDPKAPVTLVEYADMQCPVCRAYAQDVFPTLVEEYVKPGKLRMELRLQQFLGPDSVTAANAVAAASLQNRAWRFADHFYANQGTENSGYVTDGFLRGLAEDIAGLDVERLMRERRSDAASRIVRESTTEFDRFGLSGTPSFRIGRTGRDLPVFEVSQLTPEELSAPIDRLLAESGR